jgi:hypothetical protein
MPHLVRDIGMTVFLTTDDHPVSPGFTVQFHEEGTTATRQIDTLIGNHDDPIEGAEVDLVGTRSRKVLSSYTNPSKAVVHIPKVIQRLRKFPPPEYFRPS